MSYHLRGVVGVGRTTEVGAFLIPYFSSDRSNHLFAQELNTDSCIRAFRPIDLNHYTMRVDLVTEIGVDVGDDGIIAFVDPSGSIVTEPVQMARSSLRSASFGSNLSAFRQIDICYFLGDFAALNDAINRAASAFARADIGKAWKKVERTAAKHAKAAAHRAAIDIEAVIGSFVGDAALDNWIKAWRAFGPRDWLLTEGLRLAFEQSGSANARFRIAHHVITGLSAPAIPVDTRELLRENIRSWLVSDAMRTDSEIWAKVWLAAEQEGNILFDQYLQAGFNYLDSTPFGYQPRNSWTRLWKVLWQRGIGDQEALAKLAEEVLKTYGHSAHGRRLVAVLGDFIDQSRIADVLARWIIEDDRRDSQWASTYLAVLSSEYRGSKEFVELGVEWLKRDLGNLKKWAKVYEEVSKYRDENEMLEIARSWVLRANSDMNIWPEFASKVFRAYEDPKVRDLIASWLSRHPTKEDSWELSLMLEYGPN